MSITLLRLIGVFIITGLFILWMASIGHAQSGPSGTIKVLERYECVGNGAQGTYTTPLTITQHGENFLFSWTDSKGMGFRHGDNLVVAFITGNVVGSMFYQINEDRIDGWWTPGDGVVYREICKSAGIPA